MTWKLDKNRPICPQLCEQLCASIVSGEFKAGQRLMSVRELALAAGVNPNTVQRAFEQLEAQGILYSVRGAGWFVAEDPIAAQTLRQNLVLHKVSAFFDEMASLGLTAEEVKTIVKEWKE